MAARLCPCPFWRRCAEAAANFCRSRLSLLCTLAILINLSLFFFNLLPIPPLDGSRVTRNLLPYNAVQVYDRIPIWVSYLFMIFLGGAFIGAMLRPSLKIIFSRSPTSRPH